MANRVKFFRRRRRFLKVAVKCYPPLTGLVWGGFLMHGILGLEDIFTGVAAILAAFAAGVLCRRIPSSVVSKLLAWQCGCVAFFKFGLLSPAAFFFGMMDLPGRRGRYSGTFFAGLIAGALLGVVFEFAPAALLLSGVLYFLFNRYRRRARTLWQWALAIMLFAAVLFGSWFFISRTLSHSRAGQGEHSGMERLTRICCLGLSGKASPDVLLISRKVTEPEFLFEYMLMNEVYVASPGRRINNKYDLLIVEHLASSMFSAPEYLLDAMKPDGILVVPQRFCHKLPDLKWRTLPGSRNIYAAACVEPGKVISISPRSIDENLSLRKRENDDSEPIILSGAIAGILTGFESRPVQFTALLTHHNDLSYWLWGGFLFLIMVEIFLHNSTISEYYCTGISALIFGVVCGCLSSFDCGFYGGNWLFFLLAAIFFFVELPFKSPVLRTVSIGSVVLLLLAGWLQVWAIGVAALCFSGLTYAGVKSRFRKYSGKNDVFEMICVLAFAAGFLICGTMNEFTFALTAAVCSMKLWLQLRT